MLCFKNFKKIKHHILSMNFRKLQNLQLTYSMTKSKQKVIKLCCKFMQVHKACFSRNNGKNSVHHFAFNIV